MQCFQGTDPPHKLCHSALKVIKLCNNNIYICVWMIAQLSIISKVKINIFWEKIPSLWGWSIKKIQNPLIWGNQYVTSSNCIFWGILEHYMQVIGIFGINVQFQEVISQFCHNYHTRPNGLVFNCLVTYLISSTLKFWTEKLIWTYFKIFIPFSKSFTTWFTTLRISTLSNLVFENNFNKKEYTTVG